MNYTKQIRHQLFHLIKEGRIVLHLAIPVMAAQVGQNLMTFVDTVMVGNYNVKDLAGIAAGGMLFMPFLIFTNGILIALSPIAAQLYGSDKGASVGAYVRQSLYLSQFIAVPLFFIVRELAPVLVGMGIDPEVSTIADGYIHAISWGIPATLAFMTLRIFNEGVSIMKPGMYLTLAGLGCNAAINSVLIYGRFGFPALGAFGAGLATTLTWWIMCLGMVWYVVTSDRLKLFKLLERFELPQWQKIAELLRIGLPIGLSLTLEVGMFAATTLLAGVLGTNIIAGHQIALNVAATTFMVPLGLAIATTARVGWLIGQKNFSGARFSGITSLAISVLIMTTASVTIIVFAPAIAGLYTRDTAVKAIAVQLLYMAAIFQIFDGLQVVAIGALRGLKDTRTPMIFNFISYWVVGLPIGYWLGIVAPFGARGLWLGFIAGLFIAAILNNLRFFYLTRSSRMQPD